VNLIMQGGEPFSFPGGTVGCLLVHGFTASPQEMRGLGEHLAAQGYTALGIRLFGHATDIHDMLRARWTDWLASAEDGYRLLEARTDRIVLMGLSLGAALSLILATRVPVRGVVAMSTPFRIPTDPRIRLLRLLRPFVRFIPKGPPDYFDPEAASSRRAYTAYPVPAMLQVEQALVAMRACLPQVTVPVLLVHSKQDTFVPPQNMEAVYERLGSSDKATLLVENSNHLITLDSARQQVFAAATAFARRVGAGAK
jgi:carboxylesterase